MHLPPLRTLIAGAAALTLCAAALPAQAQIGYALRGDVDDSLYSVNLSTGAATLIGPVGFSDVEGLSFQPGTGTLFGVDDSLEQLITINLSTGVGTFVGNLGVSTLNPSLAFDNAGNLFIADDTRNFYSVNPGTGAATLIGSTGRDITGLTALGTTLYGLDDGNNALVTINPGTGATTLVGSLGIDIDEPGLDFDASGTLFAIGDGTDIYRIDTSTGAATFVATTLNGFEALAIAPATTGVIPEPGTVALLASGLLPLAGVAIRRRRKA